MLDPNTLALLTGSGAGGAAGLGNLGGLAIPGVAPAQIGLGLIQTVSALNRLRQLKNQPLPSFAANQSPLQENVRMYQQRVDQGLPQADINLATQANAAQQASLTRQFQDMSGGQLSNVASRMGNLNGLNLGLRLASMSAAERRNAQAALAAERGRLVSQMNMDTQARLNRRNAEEQALGQALQAGTRNLTMGIDFGLPAISKYAQGLRSKNPGAVTAQQYTGPNLTSSDPILDYNSQPYLPGTGPNVLNMTTRPDSYWK